MRPRRRRRDMKPKFFWIWLVIIIINIIFHMIPQEWIIGPAPSPENNYNQPLQSIENWLDKQQEPAAEILLDESRWLGMEDRNRIRVLERYANEKADELGIRARLTVEVSDLEENLAGIYFEEHHQIRIDEAVFREYRPEKLAWIICHEVRHAYQYALAHAWQNICADAEFANLELFRQAEDCYEGLNSYTSALDDMDTYRNQWIEEDARDYADHEIAKLLGIGTI